MQELLETTSLLESDLLHTICKVPELLSSILALWESPRDGIHVLRLVSKGTGVAALRAVRHCTLQLGEGAKPDPQHMVALIGGTSHLESLRLTILLTSGEKTLSSLNPTYNIFRL